MEKLKVLAIGVAGVLGLNVTPVITDTVVGVSGSIGGIDIVSVFHIVSNLVISAVTLFHLLKKKKA